MKLRIPPTLLRQYTVVLVVNLGVLTTGMSLAWPSPMLVNLMDAEQTPLDRPMTESEGSWMVSLGFLLAAVTNILGSYLLDIMGRKFCVMLCAVLKLLMAIFLIFVTQSWMVLLARTVMLIADCYLFVVVPVYATEIASKTHRGSLGTFLQVFSSLGIVISLSAGPFLSYHTFSYVVCGVFTICTIPMLCLPESPFYEYSKGKQDAALKTLISIRESETAAKQELEEYKISTNDVKIDKMDLLKDRTFLKSVFLCIVLFAGSQSVGYNAVTFYLQTILISTNTRVMPEIGSVVIGVMQVVASLSVTVLTRLFKRKFLLIISLAGMFLGMVGLGAFFQIVSYTEVTGALNFLPIASLLLVVFCFNAGIGALIWPTATELFEGPARAFGTSVGLILCQVVIFLTTKYFPLMTSALGPAPTYWIFSANSIIVGTLIIIFLPETKDKTFQEIQKSLGRKVEKEISA